MSDSQDSMTDEGPDPNTASMFGDTAASGASGDNYQVLARKYRPTRFEDLVGQDAMVRTLTNAFQTGRIAHAFMLTGVRGVGKTTTARLLARALNYQSDDHDGPSVKLDPAGVHCQSIMESRHPEVLELDAASRTGVADMRELLDGVRYAPVDARYKVYIIDEVHMLSTAAFNALLKTLEEPPPHVKFIFATTEIRKVPVTVLSRCQRFNLARLSTQELADHLGRICKSEGASVSPEGLQLIARAAEGSARDALSILDQAIVQAIGEEVSSDVIHDMLGLSDRSRLFDLLDAALAGRNKDVLKEVDAQLRGGAEPLVLIKDLLDAIVEISRAQALGDDYAFAGPAEWAARTKTLALGVSPAQAARYWKIMLQGFEDCSRAPDPATAAEMAVLRLTAAASLPSPEEAARLLTSGPAPDGGGAPAGAGGAGGGGRAPAPRAPDVPRGGGPRAMAVAVEQEAPGPVLRTLPEICAALQSSKQIGLLYDIEHYVRPAQIDYGLFRFAPVKGMPEDLPMRIRNWLQDITGVEWQVEKAHTGDKSLAQIRDEENAARLAELKAHPRIAEALAILPDAHIMKVETIGDGEKVVQVDFSRRRKVAETVIDDFDDDEAGGARETLDDGYYASLDTSFTDAPDDDFDD